MKQHLKWEEQKAKKEKIKLLEKQTRECLNELYKLGAHQELKKLIADVRSAYAPKSDVIYDLNEEVPNAVKPETRKRMDKLILNR